MEDSDQDPGKVHEEKCWTPRHFRVSQEERGRAIHRPQSAGRLSGRSSGPKMQGPHPWRVLPRQEWDSSTQGTPAQ